MKRIAFARKQETLDYKKWDNMKYVVVFGLGMWQGALILDWYRDKMALRNQ